MAYSSYNCENCYYSYLECTRTIIRQLYLAFNLYVLSYKLYINPICSVLIIRLIIEYSWLFHEEIQGLR